MSEIKGGLIWLLVVVAVFIGIVPFLMWGPWGGHMMGTRGMMGYGWGFMILIPVLFLLLIVLGLYFLVTGFGGARGSASSRGEGPLMCRRIST